MNPKKERKNRKSNIVTKNSKNLLHEDKNIKKQLPNHKLEILQGPEKSNFRMLATNYTLKARYYKYPLV